MRKNLQRKLAVVPPHPMNFVIAAEEGIGGDGDEDLLCGTCDSSLALSVRPEFFYKRFRDTLQIVIECPACRAHNAVPRSVPR